jgi:hypothetical protein
MTRKPIDRAQRAAELTRDLDVLLAAADVLLTTARAVQAKRKAALKAAKRS